MFKIIVITFLFLLSCTSAQKRQCEQTHWFNHGKKVALSGKRLDEDPLIKTCEKAEAAPNYSDLDLGFKAGRQEYCKPEIVYQTGRSGEFFNSEFCDEKIKTLKMEHQRGVTDYCNKDGFEAGSAGKIYNKICPGELEDDFLKEFKKGRLIFLNNEITTKREKINILDQETSQLYSQRRSSEYDLVELKEKQRGFQVEIQNRQNEDPNKVQSNPYDYEVQNKNRDIESFKQRIDSNKSLQNQLRTDIGSHQSEINVIRGKLNSL